MQRCRHENDIHNPLKILIFEKNTFYYTFYKLREPSRGEPSRSKKWLWANSPGRNWFLRESSRNHFNNPTELKVKWTNISETSPKLWHQKQATGNHIQSSCERFLFLINQIIDFICDSHFSWIFILYENYPQMSRDVRKPDFCICENKDTDQLRGNREADQRLCFRYTDSTIPLLPKYKISSL